MLGTNARLYRLSFALCLVLSCGALGLTRWSSLHVIPDADFVESWNYVLEYQGYYFSSDSSGNVFKNMGTVRLGLSEWADVYAGYAGGMTMGLKAKVLGETNPYLPSLALGVNNVLHHKEAHLFNHDSSVWKNEFYVATGKTLAAIKLRLHAGIATMPTVEDEIFTYFFGLEKYLGGFAYITLESFYRDKKIRPSLFASVRMFDKHLELSGGAIDLLGMFIKDEATPPRPGGALVNPGFWLGIRFLGNMNSPNQYGGFSSIEEQIAYQREMIKSMKHDVDSIKRIFAYHSEILDTLKTSFVLVADSALGVTSGQRLRSFAMERLVKLNTLFALESMDAEQIKSIAREIAGYGDIMVPVLKQIILDPQVDRKVHAQAMTRLGEIGTPKAADAVLDIIPQVQDADVRIEGLIAIGNMKDKRATYLLEQLANDPNEAVAFTATEVMQKLDTQAPQKPDGEEAAASLPEKIPEKKIHRTADDMKSGGKGTIKKTERTSSDGPEKQTLADTTKKNKEGPQKNIRDSVPVNKRAPSSPPEKGAEKQGGAKKHSSSD